MWINGEFVKGCIYRDRSLKDRGTSSKPRYHDCFRIEVRYNGHRWRTRYRTSDEAERALLELKKKYIDEYMRKCDWCGNTFEVTNSIQRYCCKQCAALAAKRRENKSGGIQFIDEHGHAVSPTTYR